MINETKNTKKTSKTKYLSTIKEALINQRNALPVKLKELSLFKKRKEEIPSKRIGLSVTRFDEKIKEIKNSFKRQKK